MRINHLAAVLAAVVYFLIGWLWYGFIFKAAWIAAVGPAGMAGNSATPYIVSIVMALVLSYVIAIALGKSEHPQPARQGVEFGLFMGIGIFASQTLMDSMYEVRPLALWAIDAGYVVVGMAVIGAIIGAWRVKTPA